MTPIGEPVGCTNTLYTAFFARKVQTSWLRQSRKSASKKPYEPEKEAFLVGFHPERFHLYSAELRLCAG
jgi:hypothetical protein